MPLTTRSQRVSHGSRILLLALLGSCGVEDRGHVHPKFATTPNGSPPTAAPPGVFGGGFDDAAFRQMVGSAVDRTDVFIDPVTGGVIYVYRTWIDETQAFEYYSFFAPSNPGLAPKPLLVAFHGAGTTQLDIYHRTELFEEAAARGWYLFAPVQFNAAGGPPDTSYGSAQSQIHVESVMQSLLHGYPIDQDRIYGVGFSMGGGAALSYAARHRDLKRPGVFAAVVNHTGSVALAHVYTSFHSPNPQVVANFRNHFELLFSGPPSSSPFEWQQSSVVVLDSSGSLIPGASHFAINLVTTPVQTWFNGQDELAYLRQQSTEFDSFLTSHGALGNSQVRVDITDPQCHKGHCWASLDQRLACDWLAQQTLAPFSPSGELLIDRDGGWEVFDIEQVQSGQFSSLTYSISAPLSQIDLLAVRNVSSIGLSLDDAALTVSAGASITVDTEQDAPGLLVTIQDVPQTPIAVYLDGVSLSEDCSSNAGDRWCFDASSGRLDLQSGTRTMGSWTLEY